MHIKFPLPNFTPDDAMRAAEKHYAVSGSAKSLPSERDQNFLITTETDSFVLKYSNVLEERETLDLQNSTLTHLATTVPELVLPRVCKTKSGEQIITIESIQGLHFARLLTYVPARMFANVGPHTPELLRSLGKVIATLDLGLEDFQHPAAKRELKWDLTRASWIREFLPYIQQAKQRTIVERFLTQYETDVLPTLNQLRSTLIYNDANDYNILVHRNKDEVIGVIDFGDMVCAPKVCDLAIAIAYASLYKEDPSAASHHVLAGYQGKLPLTEQELRILFPLVRMRMCVSVVNSAYQRIVEPDNAYLMLTEKGAWDLLERL